mgnify:CR=1 FL=1
MLTEHDCKIAPSTCYAHRKRLQAPSARTVRDAELKPLIQQICEANYRVYGARKVWRELHRQGHIVARCIVERLVRERGVTGAVRGKKTIATTPDSTVDRPPHPHSSYRPSRPFPTKPGSLEAERPVGGLSNERCNSGC